MHTTAPRQTFAVRAIEACTSFMTCDQIDMSYFRPLIERAAESGINALTLFIIPDSYYPEPAPGKTWTFEMGFD